MTDKIFEQLQELYTQFPELTEIEEAGALGAAAKSLGQSALKGIGNLAYKAVSKVPGVGGIAQGIASTNQPQEQQKPGFFQGVGRAIGTAINAGKQATQQAQPATAPAQEDLDVEAMQGASQTGLEGFEVDLNTAYKAIKNFAARGLTPAASKPAKPATAPAQQPQQPAQQQAAAPAPQPATTGQQEQEQEAAIKDYKRLIQELARLDSLYEEAAQPDPALIQKMQTYAKNLVAKAKDFEALKSNDQMLKALVAFVTEAQRAGLNIPGLENVNPQNLQAAIDQEKQIAASASQQLQQMSDAQIQQLIANMDRRALKKVLLDNPEVAKQLVAAMNKQPGQQPS